MIGMHLVVKRFEQLSLQELYEILRARVSVFVVEQACPYQEVDGFDPHAYHVFYEEDSHILAYLRIADPGTVCGHVAIGRVLTLARGTGLGKKLMEEAIRVARDQMSAPCIQIEAQTYATGFYESFGFRQTSQEFLEDGIPHVRMMLTF